MIDLHSCNTGHPTLFWMSKAFDKCPVCALVESQASREAKFLAELEQLRGTADKMINELQQLSESE